MTRVQLKDAIKPLDRETWQDYRLELHCISHNYYDVESNIRNNDLSRKEVRMDLQHISP